MPTVSICLPVFNGARHLSEAIDSALSQTYSDFELLIADDCSVDDSPTIIDRYAKQDKRVIAWRNERNQGLFPNYNICIKRASGKYIKPFAQDDVFQPTLLERLVGILDDNSSISVVACARRPIDANGLPIKPASEIEGKLAKPFLRDTKLSAIEAISSSLNECLNWLGEPSAQMYRSAASEKEFDTSFQQIGDLENSFHLLQSGDYFFVADELCSFRKHTASATVKNDMELAAHLDWLVLAARYSEFLSRSGSNEFEYCLNFMKSWTRDIECELNRTRRLGTQERGGVLRELSGYPDPLTPFICERNSARDLPSEYKMLGALALLHCTMLEHELRLVHDQIAQPLAETEPNVNAMVQVRPGLTAALDGLKQTLRERDKEIVALRASLNAIGNSISWKLTEPLRKVKHLIPIFITFVMVCTSSARGTQAIAPDVKSAGAGESESQFLETPNPATTPTPNVTSRKKWIDRHLTKLNEVHQHPVDLLFIGDSITEDWELDGPEPSKQFKPIWDKYYGALNAVNLGFGGDTTANVLWRLEHGEIDDVQPKVIVLEIGTNNTGRMHWSAQQTLDGINAIVKLIHEKMPTTKIVLLGILPCAFPSEETNTAINESLSHQYEQSDFVIYKDLSDLFMQNGKLDRSLYLEGVTSKYMKAIHPSTEGQERIAKALNPLLTKLLSDQPQPTQSN
jgi:glycosyltransferase involved in cell wall biosynthesis/lysophospholipase L1-like esterase